MGSSDHTDTSITHVGLIRDAVVIALVAVPKEHTSVGIYPEGRVLFEEGEPSANNLLLLEDRTCQ